jgi:hypothetical protein
MLTVGSPPNRGKITRRTKQRCGQVVRHGIGLGYCTRDITVDTRGFLEAPAVEHHASLTDPAAVGGLLLDIDGYSGNPLTVKALKLSALVWVRPGELRKAQRMQFGAYNYAQHLPVRRKMMQLWADYLDDLRDRARRRRPPNSPIRPTVNSPADTTSSIGGETSKASLDTTQAAEPPRAC